jgi:replication factor A1
VENDELRAFSILKLSTYSLNNMAGKKVMIVLKVQIVQRDAAQIGTPVDVGIGGGAAAPHAPPQQQQQPAFQQQAPPPQARQAAPSYGQQAAYGGQAQVKPEPSSYGGGGGGAVARAEPGGVYQPIDSLNPYQNRWTIKARLTMKGDMKSWNNAKG